ncbi:hypothetical protein PIB30_014787 [Stylosanthes scabra]|uniref:Uncharacterized protein n=1 Tax=Stylosanthes scabra TaxID=79078 RepID=A0ABU6Z4E4_9FABA|nr:hypothetical protein [Stylosanthes scabra]
MVLRSIYEKHRKSSRQGGSSGESRGLCGGVMDEYSKCGEGARGDVLNVVLSWMWCLLILCSLTWFLPKVSPRRFCSPRWPNKWYQSRWLIGLVLRSIYDKHRKSSRQGGSSGESRGLCGGVMDEYSKCGEGARGDVLNVETHT